MLYCFFTTLFAISLNFIIIASYNAIFAAIAIYVFQLDLLQRLAALTSLQLLAYIPFSSVTNIKTSYAAVLVIFLSNSLMLVN